MLTPRQDELWNRLEGFAFDAPGSSFPFSRKLAREQGWSPDYTHRALREYRRFLLLAATAGHPVSPSDTVDQVWHLHLTYTRSYWHDLCRDTLGCPLHHEPSRGGSDEVAKFASWYDRTLASYRDVFQEEPPADIWPPAAAAAPSRRHVDLRRAWLLPKPRHLWWTAAVVSSLGALLLVGGCSPTTGWSASLFNLPGPAFLGVYAQLWLLCFVAAFLLRRHLCKPAGPVPSGTLSADPYWNAFLAGGPVRATLVATASLATRKHLQIETGPRYRRASPPDRAVHPVEQDLWKHIPEGDTRSFPSLVKRIQETCAPIEADLQQHGLLLTPAARSRARWRPFCVALLPLIPGVIKIGVGLDREKPVGFLIILCVLTVVLAAVVLLRPVRLTRRGDDALVLARREQEDRVQTHASPEVTLLPLSVALFGVNVLPAFGHPALAQTLQPPRMPADTGSGGCGSSCGGDGGGGDGGDGGGGCGGCGGGD